MDGATAEERLISQSDDAPSITRKLVTQFGYHKRSFVRNGPGTGIGRWNDVLPWHVPPKSSSPRVKFEGRLASRRIQS